MPDPEMNEIEERTVEVPSSVYTNKTVWDIFKWDIQKELEAEGVSPDEIEETKEMVRAMFIPSGLAEEKAGEFWDAPATFLFPTPEAEATVDFDLTEEARMIAQMDDEDLDDDLDDL